MSNFFNCRLVGEGHAVVVNLLEIVIVPPSNQDADDSAGNIHLPDEALQKLYNFCESHMPCKRRVITELVCADKFDDTHIKCLQGKCVKCGFKTLWMSVRQTLVYDNSDGKLRPDVSEVWLSNMIWDSIKTGGDGSNSEDDLRHQHEGTVIAFMDKAIQAFYNFTPHRIHIE